MPQPAAGLKIAALKLLRKLLHNQPEKPELIVTDGLGPYDATLGEVKLRHLHRPGRFQENNRAEKSHLPILRIERKQQGIKSRSSVQIFLTKHASVQNNFSTQRHINSRSYVRQLSELSARERKMAAA